MIHDIRRELEEHPHAAYDLLRRLIAHDTPLLDPGDIAGALEHPEAEPLRGGAFGRALRQAQEAAVAKPWLYLAVRESIATWRYLAFQVDELQVDEIDHREFLRFEERLVTSDGTSDELLLEIDFAPFNRGLPKAKQTRSIGRGVDILNRRLSSQLFETAKDGDTGTGARLLFEFLQLHELDHRQLMLNDRLESVDALRDAVHRAEALLAERPDDEPFADFAHALQELGFEAGWGRDAARARETLQLLSEVLEAPTPQSLEELLGRIPMISSVVILSPHGFFGQANVMGLPDTGGQVVYILDQVRALEREMRERLLAQGLDVEPDILVVSRLIPEDRGTTVSQRLEPILGTDNARILRVPFREADGRIVPQWISRFEIWPYLERFTLDVEHELLAEIGGTPDLLIGNYSDGNLVATLLSNRLGVTLCTIAHALEKAKYRHAELRWAETDAAYHFSCQFTADLIAMNAADFIITSTYQEIAGDAQRAGQYESYGRFTMPGLYRVVDGIDLFDLKFNIVSPGANPDIFFSLEDTERRRTSLHGDIEDLVLGAPDDSSRGRLTDPDKPLLFSMARLDTVKNLTGLVEWYARSEQLREQVNLLVIAGRLDPAESSDAEERREIERMHALFDRHDLDGSVRWVGRLIEKQMSGELYRWIADRRGAFVQPARFEAFGLTVIESMASGLPIFATCHGGPSEIIEDGVSGFHIDPDRGDEAAARMVDFFARVADDEAIWHQVSRAGIERVEARYTWRRYAQQLMTQSRVYGFWKFVTDLERQDTRRYLEMFYALQMRDRAHPRRFAPPKNSPKVDDSSDGEA